MSRTSFRNSFLSILLEDTFFVFSGQTQFGNNGLFVIKGERLSSGFQGETIQFEEMEELPLLPEGVVDGIDLNYQGILAAKERKSGRVLAYNFQTKRVWMLIPTSSDVSDDSIAVNFAAAITMDSLGRFLVVDPLSRSLLRTEFSLGMDPLSFFSGAFG